MIDGPGGTPVAVVAALVGVGFFAFCLWEVLREPVASLQRWSMVVLRGLAVVAAWCVVAQPSWIQALAVPGGGQLAVLVDASESMGISADGGATRFAKVEGWLARWLTTQREGGRPISVFTTTPEGGANGLPAAHLQKEGATVVEGRSPLLASLRTLVDTRDELGAILIVSDGRCVPRCTESFSGLRVHSVVVEETPRLKDSAIVDIDADPVAFLRDRGRVLVELRSTHRESLDLELRYEGRVIERKSVPLIDGSGKVELSYLPIERGAQAYEVAIAGDDPEDAIEENNRVAFVVEVRPSRYRVLHVSGRPSWDQRFLRTFLKERKDLDLISFFILRALHDLTLAATEEMALIPFPTEELFSQHLRSFDLVIFQNFNYGPYRMGRFLPGIAQYVKEGGSFAMIGGELSFAQGGYAQTAVADILPVELPSESAGEISGLFSPQLDEGWKRHPVVGLHPSPAQTSELWKDLPQVEGANLLLTPKPGAATLLRHDKGGQSDAAPILVLGEAEAGRVLALGIDASWTWRFTRGGMTGDGSLYTRFWDRALRWLTRDPLLEPSRIALADVRVGPGEKMAVRGRFSSERYEPLAGQKIELGIVRADGERIAPFTSVELDTEGRVETELKSPESPGAHFVVAEMFDAAVGEKKELARTAFSVSGAGRELADIRPDAQWLERLAESTEGSFFASLDAVPPPHELPTDDERIIGTQKVRPFASIWFLLLAAALFGVEWGLRRRWRIGR